MRSKLFHMGIRSTVSRNNLSNANERRDWLIRGEVINFFVVHAKVNKGPAPRRGGFWFELDER